MIRFWSWNAVLFLLMAAVFAVLYVHWVPPMRQVVDEPLDLSPGVTPLRLIANNRDLGQFATGLVPPVQAVMPAVPASATSNPVGESPVACSASDSCRSLSGWRQKDPEHWVIQVLAVSSKEAALSYIESQPDASAFVYYTDSQQGNVRYVVDFGDFTNRDEAIAVAQVREFANISKAFARSVQSVIDELELDSRADALTTTAMPPALSTDSNTLNPANAQSASNLSATSTTTTSTSIVNAPATTSTVNDELTIPGTDNSVNPADIPAKHRSLP